MNCFYGGYLSKNNEVFMIDVSETLVDKINKEGVLVEDSRGASLKYYPKAYTDSREIGGEVDLVLVFVKTMYNDSALRSNQHLFRENTYVMTMQNGGGNDEVFLKYVRPERLIYGTTQAGCLLLGAGHTKNTNPGEIHIGCAAPNKEGVMKVVELFREAGFSDTFYEDDPGYFVWRKLIVNAVLNSLSTALQMPFGFIGTDTWAQGLAMDIIREAVAVANAEGAPVTVEDEADIIMGRARAGKEGQASMFQDFLHDRRMEIDAITGYIIEKAKKNHIPVPVNETIYRILHALEGTYSYEYRLK